MLVGWAVMIGTLRGVSCRNDERLPQGSPGNINGLTREHLEKTVFLDRGWKRVKHAFLTEMAFSRELPEHGLRRGEGVRLINELCPGGREGY
jgi:hypothetical protein